MCDKLEACVKVVVLRPCVCVRVFECSEAQEVLGLAGVDHGLRQQGKGWVGDPVLRASHKMIVVLQPRVRVEVFECTATSQGLSLRKPDC